MKKQAKPQTVLASWAHRNGPERFGERGTVGVSDTCTSFWLSLRERVQDDPYRWGGLGAEVMSDIGLWVWVSSWDSGRLTFIIEPRLRGVHSADLRKAERLLKELRALCKRMPQKVEGEAFEPYLRRTLKALRITHAVEYRGIGQDDTFAMVDALVPTIVEHFDALAQACEANRLRMAA